MRKLALATTASIGALACFTSEAMAGQWHINGNTLYYTGGVSRDDPYELLGILSSAEEQGVTINTVVFRNSPGGAASGGVGMGTVIRAYGLDTVLDGGCFSACADAFVGGVNRYYTDYNIPAYSLWKGTELGIHGAASGGQPLPYPQQEIYIDYYREMLGDEGFAIAGDRIIQAHYELTQQSGFLRYFDPNKTDIATRFCPTANLGEDGNCTAYPDVTMTSDTIATSGEYVTVNDRLFVTNNVSGNIETNWDKGVRYSSNLEGLAQFHVDFPEFDFTDKYSSVTVLPGGKWSLDTAAAAELVMVDGGELEMLSNSRVELAEAIFAYNGGMIRMNGGELNTLTEVFNGGVLAGNGTLGATMVIRDGGTLIADGLVMRPYDFAPIAPFGFSENLRTEKMRIGQGRILNVLDGGTLAFSVSNQTTQSPLTLEQARYFLIEEDAFYGDFNIYSNHNKAQLAIGEKAALALDIQQGYYASGHIIPLVSGIVDSSPLQLPVEPCTDSPQGYRGYNGVYCGFADEDLEMEAPDIPFVQGKFLTAKRIGDDGYEVDLTKDGAVFHARNNSLLTFNILQSGDGISLEANPAFEDVALFGNSRSGDGLGIALRDASHDPNTTLAPLLGYLQFADRDIARRQSGALRGDGHSTLRLAGRSFIDNFSEALHTATRNPVARSMSVGTPMASATTDLMYQEGRIGIGGGDNGSMVVAAPAPTVRSPYDLSRPTTFWASGFGRSGAIKAYEDIGKVEYNGYGVLMGAHRELSDRFRLGAAFGYGTLNANTRPNNNFNGEIDALSVAVYGDANYRRGYVSGQIGYTNLESDTRRVISGIDGLDGSTRSEYDSNAFFARFEHGFQLGSKDNASVTLLAPVVDYVNMSGTTFKDQGNNPTALEGDLKDVESLRAGIGLQFQKEVIKDDWRVTPYARVVWQRELQDRDAISVNHFALAPELAFDAASRQLGRDAVDWNIGLRSSTRSENVNISVEYQGQAIGGETAHGLQAAIQYRF
ncbi:autotransporter domain-containing protein [uncultured Brevundimonas sp.]|uniref:autotransporter domain-containing protein n=1 Tax=uncultured Brevundimonas sp. TaxID=213418 RepID=UPI00261465BB|nr:autotransporter domain-containing protein [uncultured Brevundimonas sp.]